MIKKKPRNIVAMIIALRTLAAALIAVSLSLAFGKTGSGEQALGSAAAVACQAITCD